MANPQVTFDYAAWVARYPEFAAIPEAVALLYFQEASLYHLNDGTGPVTEDWQQLMLLNMLTAHIAAMNYVGQPLAGQPLVGPLTNASEGSVSVGVQTLAAPGTQAWFVITRYGAAYWLATAPYRTMRYRVPLPRSFSPPYIWPLEK